ncbi:AlkZ family DNA glycosylase [Paenibacillus sp. GSMTC-2017]|uniref:winged helix DNA-binding domain-containing protein n=1 Tax=Paenibacillus sp. GSMTC-2017 TaxID=2794350 RepID=UPI0018D871DF|nr:winged helix DNA-binding domain-containing protein [Paenibacillus sp. GSMTC-2017]MBH5318921.1 AlkZ family DNA glycosylase [Paenibacillus sp. GSMTC-2017]
MTPSSHSTNIPSGQIVTKKRLNRALLDRQLLLHRSSLSPLEAIEQLAGIQAQSPTPPYFALWSRLVNFEQEQLAELILNRRAVRIALMRSTIHLVSARDCLSFRSALQPMMKRLLHSNFGRKLEGIDIAMLAATAQVLVEEKPLTFEELGKRLMEHWPNYDAGLLANVARNLLPLVQVPPRGLWKKSGAAIHTTMDNWLREGLVKGAEIDSLLLRFLKAFGPASVKDMQTWSGLNKLQPIVNNLMPLLRVWKNEEGIQLFDLLECSLPDCETPAPPRFLSEFDNMLISFNDRSRIMSPAYKPLVFTNNGIVRATFLIDGFVQGLWSIQQTNKEAVLQIKPFEALHKVDLEALMDEGLRLLQFATPEHIHRISVDQ